MSARKLRTSWWVDFRFRGTRYRIRSPENSRAGAAAYEAHLRQRLAAGEPIDRHAAAVDSKTYAEFVKDWFETYVKTNNKPSVQANKRSKLNCHLLPFFGNMKLADIHELRIERFTARKREEGLGAQTINNLLSVLSKSLASACEWRLLEKVPRIRLLRTPPSRFDFLTPEESQRLFEATRGDGLWYSMILCGLHTGLRIGELMGLEWRDIDFPNKQLVVARSLVKGYLGTPKNNRTRVVPLSEDLEAALRERSAESGPVFAIDGKRLDYGVARSALDRACMSAGLRRIGWHALRHTFASQLVMASAPMRAVQELLGHATLQMTMRYSHLSPSALRSAVRLLPAVQPNSPQTPGQPAVNAPMPPIARAPWPSDSIC